MATTTNFNWETPDDTDLVKDGAAAIRTALNGVDTSFVDLKGGTTGQVLSKASGTDLDFTWVAQDDSNAIQNAIVDAKGDLIAATAADTPARLAVGTNGQVLTADSTAATGLAWSTISSTPTFVGCFIGNSAGQSISNSTWTAILFDTETIDTDAYHSTSSNTSRITIPAGKAGKYFVTAQSKFDANATGRRIAKIYKNGTGDIQTEAEITVSSSSYPSVYSSAIMSLAVGDYLEFYVFQNSGANLNSTQTGTQFGVQYLGA